MTTKFKAGERIELAEALTEWLADQDAQPTTVMTAFMQILGAMMGTLSRNPGEFEEDMASFNIGVRARAADILELRGFEIPDSLYKDPANAAGFGEPIN